MKVRFLSQDGGSSGVYLKNVPQEVYDFVKDTGARFQVSFYPAMEMTVAVDGNVLGYVLDPSKCLASNMLDFIGSYKSC